VPLSDVAGMVARGEAVEREEDLPVVPPVTLVADQPAASTGALDRADDEASLRA
jgi:hypothetical protein